MSSPHNTHPSFAAPFLLLVAIGLAVQTYYTSKRGYVYCGRTEVVEKAKDPRKYRVWLCIQLSLVLIPLMLSVVSFWA